MTVRDTSDPRLPATLRFIERGWLSSNQIVGIEEGEATVVDSGYVKHEALTVALMRQVLGGGTSHLDAPHGGAPTAVASDASLTRLVNTHLHSDHCGGNAALARAFGCAITIPQASARDVADWDEAGLSFAATGQRCPRFVHDSTLAPGDTLRLGGLEWRAHAAPGHDPKSLVFHCESHRLLISADALWESGFGVLFSGLEVDGGFDEQRSVLDFIESLRVDLVLPGHGHAFDDVAGALARARATLASLRKDPSRHARHALKVLVKFLLLDVERITMPALHAHVAGAESLRLAAARIGMSPEAAAERAAAELVAQGLLRREGEWVIDAT